MPPVTFNFASENEKKMFNIIQRLEKELAKTQAGMNKIGDTGKSSFSGVGKEMKAIVGGLLGANGIQGAFNTVIGQLRTAYSEMRQRQRETMLEAQTIGQARTVAFMNIPSTFQGGFKAVDDMVERISEKSKLPIKNVYQAVGPAASAMGSASPKALENAVTLGSTLESLTGGIINAGLTAGSLLDISRATGVENATTNLGWLKQAGTASRIVDPQSQLRMVPNITAAAARGIAPEQAMEMQAAMSQLMTDITGEQASTGFMNFINDLYREDLIPKIKKTMKGKKIEWQPLEGGLQERIKQLQESYEKGDEETKKAIEKKLGERARLSGFLIQMLEDTETYKREIKAAQEKVTAPNETAAIEAKEFLKASMSGPYGRTAYLETVAKSDIEKKKLTPSRMEGAKEEQAMRYVSEARRQEATLPLMRKISDLFLQAESFLFNKPYAQTAIEAEKKNLAPANVYGAGMFYMPPNPQLGQRSREELEQSKDTINVLKEMLNEQKKTNLKLDKTINKPINIPSVNSQEYE